MWGSFLPEPSQRNQDSHLHWAKFGSLALFFGSPPFHGYMEGLRWGAKGAETENITEMTLIKYKRRSEGAKAAWNSLKGCKRFASWVQKPRYQCAERYANCKQYPHSGRRGLLRRHRDVTSYAARHEQRRTVQRRGRWRTRSMRLLLTIGDESCLRKGFVCLLCFVYPSRCGDESAQPITSLQLACWLLPEGVLGAPGEMGTVLVFLGNAEISVLYCREETRL